MARANQECGFEDDQGAKSKGFYIVFSPALDLIVKEHRVRVRAHSGNERECFCIVRLRDFRKGDNSGVIDFFEVFFAAGRLDCRAETTEVDFAANLRGYRLRPQRIA